MEFQNCPFVVRVDARQCEVMVDGEVRQARMRGRLFENRGIDKAPVAVGDRVVLSGGASDLAIDEILPRSNLFARRAAGDDANRRQILATNVDQVVVVNSVGIPAFSSIVADRILAACSFSGIPTLLVLNKIDKGKRGKLRKFEASYANSGADVLQTSATENIGIEELVAKLKGRTSVLYGLSGVGKSTLMNAIDPSLNLEVREASVSLQSGRHTTTFTRWYPLAVGGAMIDTPGVRKFRPFGIPPHELRLHYAEMRELGKACKYPACMHRGEPDCAVQKALDDGDFPPSRMRSYIEILNELEEAYGGTGSNEKPSGPDHKARR